MHSTSGINSTKARRVLFINSFVEHFSNEMLEVCLHVDKSSNGSKLTLASLFKNEMTNWLSIQSFSLGDKRTSEVNKFLYLSYIKSYIVSFATQFANVYAEQLQLLQLSEYGIVRFSRIVADACVRYMKSKQSIKVEMINHSIESAFDRMLSDIVSNPDTLAKDGKKSLKLENGDKVKLSRFLKDIGIRQQVFSQAYTHINKKFKYYNHKRLKLENVKYGFRNALYSEVDNEKEFEVLETQSDKKSQSIYTIYVTENDIKEYLSAIVNPSNPLFDFSQNGFLSYISELYSLDNNFINVVCHKLNLSGLDISGAIFDGVIFNSCDFSQANFTNTIITNAVFDDCVFHGAVLNNTKIDNSNMDFIDLSGAYFQAGNQFSKTTLRFANLSGIDLNDTSLVRVNLTGANCIETDFRKAKYEYLVTDKIRTISTCVEGKQHALELLSKVDTPFLPYQVDGLDNCHTANEILDCLFTDSSVRPGDTFEVDNMKLYHLAYGFYAIGETDNILGVRKLYYCDKRNRSNATEFFFDLVESIEKRNQTKTDCPADNKEMVPDTILSHDSFMADIDLKSKQQINEYATFLAESIFEYDMSYYKNLKFYEIMQEAMNDKNKKVSANFQNMNESYNRIYYKVYSDIMNSSVNTASCDKVIMLYVKLAEKLCYGFYFGGKRKYSDLHGAAAIIQAITKASTKLKGSIELHHSCVSKIDELSNLLLPYNNFANMRKVVTDKSIPYLPILARDILMSFEENHHSHIKQIIALGVIQDMMLYQQIGPKQMRKSTDQIFIQSDFINHVTSIKYSEVEYFLENGDLLKQTQTNIGLASGMLASHGIFATKDNKSSTIPEIQNTLSL